MVIIRDHDKAGKYILFALNTPEDLKSELLINGIRSDERVFIAFSDEDFNSTDCQKALQLAEGRASSFTFKEKKGHSVITIECPAKRKR